jgi:hypothetical protein
MTSLGRIVAAHPLAEKLPYKAIHFAGVSGHGTPLYTVGEDTKKTGATTALRAAFRKFGGRCFHCNKRMPPNLSPEDFSIDHLRPKRDGGKDLLHNLVLACRPCNLAKGSDDVFSFRPRGGIEYLKALDDHLVRCLSNLDRA